MIGRERYPRQLVSTAREVPMNEQAVAVYCICDELAKCLGIQDDVQAHMTTPEIMTFALLAALHFQGDYRKARLICIHHGYFRRPLSLGRLVRRIHRIEEQCWWSLFHCLRLFLSCDDQEQFIVDSFPVKAYENHRSFRARIFKGSQFHGYSASRKQYYFGLKIHMIVDAEGVPIELCITPGSTSDISGLRRMPLNLPEGASLFGDKAYLDYGFEDSLREILGIDLIAARKKNLTRQHTCSQEYVLKRVRNRIETVFSSIVSRMPRTIRARTEAGFALKVFFFIIAYMINLWSPEGCR